MTMGMILIICMATYLITSAAFVNLSAVYDTVIHRIVVQK